jgi:hypothetical protein
LLKAEISTGSRLRKENCALLMDSYILVFVLLHIFYQTLNTLDGFDKINVSVPKPMHLSYFSMYCLSELYVIFPVMQ